MRYDLPSTLVFPSIEPVMAYLESTRSIREPQLPETIHWDDLMLVMREQISRVLNHFGELVVNKVTGVLVASDEGGFIREFALRLNGELNSGCCSSQNRSDRSAGRNSPPRCA